MAMAAPAEHARPIDLPWKCYVWSAELLPEGGEAAAGKFQLEVFLFAPVGAAGAPSATLTVEVDPSEPKFLGITLPEEWVTAAACEVTAQWKSTRLAPTGCAAAEAEPARWSARRQFRFPSFEESELEIQERGGAAGRPPETTGALWRKCERLAKDKDMALEAQAKTHSRSIQLAAQVARLTVEVEALRALEPADGQDDKLQDARNRVESLELQLGRANASVEALRDRAQATAAEGASRSSARELAVQAAEDKLQVAQAEAGALRVEVRKLETSRSDAEALLAQLRRENTALTARTEELESLGGRAAESEAQARSEQSSEAALRFQITQLEEENAQLRRHLASANEGAASALQKESETQQAYVELRSRRQAATRELQADMHALREALEGAKRTSQHHKDAAMAARLEAAQAKARAAPAAATAGPSAESLARELASSQERLRIANLSIEDLRSAARRAEAKARDHMETIDSLMARLVAASDHAPRRPPPVDTAGDHAMAHDQAELEQLRPRVQSLRAELEALRGTLRSVRQTLKDERYEAAERTSELMARLIQAQEALGPEAAARLDPLPAAAQPRAVPVPPPPVPAAAGGGNRAAFEEAAALERAAEERRRAQGAAEPRDL